MGPQAKDRMGAGATYGKRVRLGKWGLTVSISLNLLLLQEVHGFYEGVGRERNERALWSS